MSLLSNVRNFRYHNFSYLLFRLIKHRTKSICVEVDPLDVFTTQLMQEKANKWESFKLKHRIIAASPPQKVKNSYQVMDDINVQTLNDILSESINENNPEKIMTILKTCKKQKMVSVNIITDILSYFGEIGHVDGIKYIQKIYEEANPTFLQVHAGFQQYLAEAVWVKGNIPKALIIFNDVYRNNVYLRRPVRFKLRYLFYDAIQKNSEAIMVAISKFTEDLANEFKDYIPMANLWKCCLLSEWYSDQVLAIDLLDRHRELLKVLLPQISYIVATALQYHNTESVYKLLEILLKYDCKMQCTVVLVALFDYKFQRRDLFSCSQILKWSTNYNILLPALQQKKMLLLLLDVKPNEIVKMTNQTERKDYTLRF